MMCVTVFGAIKQQGHCGHNHHDHVKVYELTCPKWLEHQAET